MSRLAARAMLAALIGSLRETQAEIERREDAEARFDEFAEQFPLPVTTKTPEERAERRARKKAKKAAQRKMRGAS